MKWILEKNNFYKEGDIVIIEYWYNMMLCPVKIIKKIGRKFEVSHDNEYSKIKNAPNEFVKSVDIIDKLRIKV